MKKDSTSSIAISAVLVAEGVLGVPFPLTDSQVKRIEEACCRMGMLVQADCIRGQALLVTQRDMKQARKYHNRWVKAEVVELG
jgi:hypothetical protein